MRLKIGLWIIALSLLHFHAAAQGNQKSLVKDLYDKSGMEEQIAQLPSVIQTAFSNAASADDHLKALPGRVLLDIKGAVSKAYAPGDIKQTMLKVWRDDLSRENIEKVLEWLNSPLGQKITHLEENASTPEAYADMQRFASELKASPPDPERLKILRKLDSAMKATQGGVEVAMNTQLAITMAIMASLPREQQPSYENLVASLEKLRPQIRRQVENHVLISLLYTYQNLSNEGLEQYLSFASAPAGTRYHTVTLSGLKKALMESSYKWGEAIADILEQSKSKSEA